MSQITELLTPKKNVIQRIVDVLVGCQSEEGIAWVTRAYLAQNAECSEAAIPRALRQLAHAGVLSRHSLINDVGLNLGIQCEILLPELRAHAEPGRQPVLMRRMQSGA